jgi:hypothetical protein
MPLFLDHPLSSQGTRLWLSVACPRFSSLEGSRDPHKALGLQGTRVPAWSPEPRLPLLGWALRLRRWFRAMPGFGPLGLVALTLRAGEGPSLAGETARLHEHPGQAKQAPGAQGAGAQERARRQHWSWRTAEPALRTHLGSGRPQLVRASCRSLDPSSCPSPCLCLLCARTSPRRSERSARTAPGDGDTRQVWSKGWGRLWEKFVPRMESELPDCWGRAAQGRLLGVGGEQCGRGVRSRPPGTSYRSVPRSP